MPSAVTLMSRCQIGAGVSELNGCGEPTTSENQRTSEGGQPLRQCASGKVHLKAMGTSLCASFVSLSHPLPRPHLW